MSSFKVNNTILIIFIVLTLIFGSLFAFEFFQVQQVKSSSTTTSTIIITLTSSTTSTFVTTETEITTSVVTVTPASNVADEGVIKLWFPNRKNVYLFDYRRMGDFPAGTSVTFKNVTFFSKPINFLGCEEYDIMVTFPDGMSEETGAGYCGTEVLTSVAFTNHSNPIAGVMYVPSFYLYGGNQMAQPFAPGFYILVSE